jgi:hypothetical protein
MHPVHVAACIPVLINYAVHTASSWSAKACSTLMDLSTSNCNASNFNAMVTLVSTQRSALLPTTITRDSQHRTSYVDCHTMRDLAMQVITLQPCLPNATTHGMRVPAVFRALKRPQTTRRHSEGAESASTRPSLPTSP